MCIRNFINRRGTPREIYSDNGTNFKAAEKIICDKAQTINFNAVQPAFDDIKWKFNPPAAPHMGGAWERLVRSVKTVLYAICPARKFTSEGLQSALWEVEFILNSRPLTFVSLDSKDDEAITPNHLLLGSASGYKPVFKTTHTVQHTWQAVQEFADQFWRRWVREYVPDLARRGKWFTKRPPIAAGDVVVILDETLPRNRWPKGIVEQTILAKDNQVRRVIIRTANGTLQRPVAKVAVLDVGCNGAKQPHEESSFTGGGMLPPKSTDCPADPTQPPMG
ncbi:uncharacterized protein [Drosophila tropicalis]|uniref:uncharacterized protein n=1 Tax=Drosophila tropicalis TaxID=46794 RepID=UPI0035ABDBA8